MKFISRKVNGEWRLAIRHGRVIGSDYRLGHTDPLVFTRWAAFDLATHLNQYAADTYSKYVDRNNKLVDPTKPVPDEVISSMAHAINVYLKVK